MIGPQHLRMARAGLGWTLIDLSERSGVNPNTISRYEQGQEGMVGKLRKLEAALRAAGVMFTEDTNMVGVQVPLLEELARKHRRRVRADQRAASTTSGVANG